MDRRKVAGSTCAVLCKVLHGVEECPDKDGDESEAGVMMPEAPRRAN